MKLTAQVMGTLALLVQAAAGATYSDLSAAQCDTANRVIYDGQGHFAVRSAAETEIEVRLNLNSLHSYVNSNDYKSGSPLLLWETNAVAYGLADIADTDNATGEREPELCFYWAGTIWRPHMKIPYSTLQHHAKDGVVTLKLTNSQSQGVRVSSVSSSGAETVLLQTDDLKSVKIHSTQGYRINLNYVTALTINSKSTLNTDDYEAPKDFTQAYNSNRTGAETLGRVMFMGDSITHGVNDQTWRWQLFKILVDNGIEAEIVGPREGYTPGYSNLTTSDQGAAYGGTDFPNVHLAQSSGRTHNIISGSNAGMTGVNYGGHSTKSAAATFNCDTWCCLMGTNDLLSDGGYTEADFVRKMQNVLGGKVTAKQGKYNRRPTDDWGNMGKIAADTLQEDSDVLYIMAVPCWGNHHNNNQPDRHLAVQRHNHLLEAWCEQYAKKHGKKIIFADVNRGMVDFTLPVPFSWPDSMSNKPGRDGLHPNEQGSLIIAGNLAQTMGIGGRTAGLPRESATDWERDNTRSAKNKKKNGSKTIAADFSADTGYSAEFTYRVGNGKKGGWEPHDNATAITLSDGANSGCLRISECALLWGDTVLYCTDNSAPEHPVRVVWHPGDAALNVATGYYVWVGDMLVGQGLSPAEATTAQKGIDISLGKSKAEISAVRYTHKPLAPATDEACSPSHAYKWQGQ